MVQKEAITYNLTEECLQAHNALYELGAIVPLFSQLNSLAMKLDVLICKIKPEEQSDWLLDFHTVICRWLIRVNKHDIILALKKQKPGEGMVSILLLDTIYNYAMSMAKKRRDIDFLLDLLIVCKWPSAQESIKRVITEIQEDREKI